MKVDIFSGVGNQIDEVLNRIIENVQSGWVAGLLTTAKVGIALYITIFGYMVLSGKKESPLPDLIWDLCRFAIVLVFLDTASGYLSMMNEAVDGIQGFLTGGLVIINGAVLIISLTLL
ncbi:hypothetical protein A6A19_00375 [Actinobacillus delphinicola]|uniref:type IV secretion system protein n=1 Tax=Actinobacillus delphinicola TaxID=51161 RepID=UPI0024417E2A|nr:type IV secretion system protein [Actinobacillus delphinicola]MDG6896501.1 hypothetical protein [Actinobacillus delphinicola]